jgi:hypothetical protein
MKKITYQSHRIIIKLYQQLTHSQLTELPKLSNLSIYVQLTISSRLVTTPNDVELQG